MVIATYREHDFSQPFTRESVDFDVYNKKFVDADKYIQEGSSDVVALRKLLLDPTTWCYLNQRLDGERMKLFPYQDAIINDPHRFIFFRAANQIGKSILLDAKAARNILLDHGKAHNEAIVSKTLPQSTYQMRRVKAILQTMTTINWSEEKGTADSMSIITVDIKDDNGKVKYTNMLICAPCTEGLLGYDLHELDLDEFEFWDVDLSHFINQIAEPRTYSTRGRITIFSNPNGGDNYGADLEKMRLPSGELKYHTYIFNYLDKPGNTLKELEDNKAGKVRHVIESTLMAIRSLSDRNFFTAEEIDRSLDKNVTELSLVGKQAIYFLDVGVTHDQSCLTGGYVELDPDYDEDKEPEQNRPFIHFHITLFHIYPVGYPLSRVIGSFDPKQAGDGWHEEKSVRTYLTESTDEGILPVFGYDVTGNKGLVPLFDAIGIQAEDVNFSGPTKSAMYIRYKYCLEKGLLHRPDNKVWEKQAKTLVATKSARGYLLINAAGSANKSKDSQLKRIPDDTQDSTAGFIYLADNPDLVPASLTFF